MSAISQGARRLPAPELRPYLRAYEGYRLSGFPAGTHVGMPSPYLTVIITIGDPLEIGTTSHPQQPGGRWDALASGISPVPCTIVHDGNQHGIQLALTPLGARALLGVPASALGAWLVDLDDVMGTDATRLRERISALPGWRERFDVLDEVLSRRLDAELRRRGEVSIDPALRWSWGQLVGSGGQARVATVADEVGWSRRHLVNRFTAEFGVTPKESARIARFARAHAMLRHAQPPTLATVAAGCGYYDQAHMAREWRELAGMAPSVWRASEVFTFVQAAADTALAESMA